MNCSSRETKEPAPVDPAKALIDAFRGLDHAFALAGLKPPLAVLVEAGQRKEIDAALNRHKALLSGAQTGTVTSIWGIQIVGGTIARR